MFGALNRLGTPSTRNPDTCGHRSDAWTIRPDGKKLLTLLGRGNAVATLIGLCLFPVAGSAQPFDAGVSPLVKTSCLLSPVSR